MFNGIIYNTGLVCYIKKNKKSTFVGIRTKIKFQKRDIGSSVSCDGVCLTIEKIFKDRIYFYISNETLKRSNLRYLKINQTINLEKSLFFGQNISGHFTQGHVDTVARVKKISFIEKTWLLKFRLLDNKMNKYLLEKASISINGVSLTISKVNQNFFEVNIIPHTLKLTNLKNLKLNSFVNVELDILSKYIYKYSN
jgi:riboflavin synthase